MKKINKILVPVDFSECSINAFKNALYYAKKLKAKLYLVNVYSLPVVIHQADMTMSYSMSHMTIDHLELLNEFKNKYNEDLDIEIEILSISGFFLKEITYLIDTKNINLVIMGTNGNDSLDDQLFGTDTSNLVRISKIPIIALRKEHNLKNISEIGLTIDFLEISNPILDFIKSFTSIFKYKNTLVHVQLDLINKEISLEKERELQRIENHLGLENCNSTILNSYDINMGLKNYFSENHKELLAVIVRKHGFFHKLLHGTGTKRIALNCDAPLLFIPEDLNK